MITYSYFRGSVGPTKAATALIRDAPHFALLKTGNVLILIYINICQFVRRRYKKTEHFHGNGIEIWKTKLNFKIKY